MDVEITTSDPENVSAKDCAIALISAVPDLYYVASVTVRHRETGEIVDRWDGGR